MRRADFFDPLDDGTLPMRPNGRVSEGDEVEDFDGAMNTDFGSSVDPDQMPADAAADLMKAMDKYHTFHSKDPLRLIKIRHDLPKELICVGDCVSVMYRTDKWYKDGEDVDYKHVHDPIENQEYKPGHGVRMYEPARSATAELRQLAKNEVGGVLAPDLAVHRSGPPVSYPKAMTMLGKCLGFFVRRYDDGEVYECNPRNTYLFCSPKGDLLAVYSPETQPDGSVGFLCLMAGGKLRVIKDGIDG